jgi:hypothetical protein
VAEEKVQGVFIEYDMHFLTFQIIIFVGQMHWLQFKININANWSFQLFDGMIICFREVASLLYTKTIYLTIDSREVASLL